jgi:hypothetical protein
MLHILDIIKKHLIAIVIMAFVSAATPLFGQDTLAGNYPLLSIKSGIHVIKSVVTVKGKLDIEAGAKIELIEQGIIVCEGALNIAGALNNKIEIFGKSNVEGVGIVIRGLDSTSNSTIDIRYATFKNLQLPLFFDFGWKRAGVNISDNYFINNIGKVSVIQVLNPPFNFNLDSSYIDFKVKNNVFTGNNAALYFEDLKSDHINFEISNNAIIGNNVYGFKNYNISTNVLYGRVDQLFSRFNPKIENNSFAFNYLVDNITDTVVHLANFGVYGTDKTIDFKNNYLGSTNKDIIQKSIYDQTLNYNAPKVEFEPFLAIPSENNPSHVYEINNLDNSFLQDTIIIKEPLKGLVLKSNTTLNFSKAKFGYSYFKDDSSLKIVDTTVTYDVQPNGNSTKLTITKNVNPTKKLGYYNIGDIIDTKDGYVPEVKVGYIAYLNDLRRRKLIAELLKVKKTEDSLKMPPPPADSIKNQFQKIEAPLKSRLEFGLYTGLAIFNGTISQSSLFSNDKNLFNGININYTIFSNISASMTIASFKLSNSDANSNNNEQQARGMNFSTSMLGISTSVNYDFVDNRLYTKARKIRPSIGFGLDVNSFSPSGTYNGVEYKLQPLGTGGQLIDSTKKAYSALALGYFFNFKIKYQINRFNSVGLHMSIHKSLSDYLDDVGPDVYPSVDQILKSKVENKDAALYFSNPTSRNVVGQYRNSPNSAKDGYINFGIFYSRRLFK